MTTRKILIGIHDKNCSGRATTWVMKQFPRSGRTST